MRQLVAAAINRGVRAIAGEQKIDGLIASTVPDEADGTREVRSPFIPTFVHAGLAKLDTTADSSLTYARRVAKEIRSAVQRYVASEEQSDHTWRFFGHDAPMDADSDTTACCAAVQLDAGMNVEPYLVALSHFQTPEGRYASYRDKHGTLYSWILPDGSVVKGIDRVVNANVLRLLGMAGRPTFDLWLYLDSELASGHLGEGSPDYPSVLTFLYAVARAGAETGHALSPAAVRQASKRLAELRLAAGGFGGPLSSALGLSIGIALGVAPETVADDTRALLTQQHRDGSWSSEAFFVGDYGAPALSTAFAVEALTLMLTRSTV